MSSFASQCPECGSSDPGVRGIPDFKIGSTMNDPIVPCTNKWHASVEDFEPGAALFDEPVGDLSPEEVLARYDRWPIEDNQEILLAQVSKALRRHGHEDCEPYILTTTGGLKHLRYRVQPAPSTEISTYVDKAMFDAEEIEEEALNAPKVYLLQATADPLGAVAAMSMMYEGRVVRDLAEITDDERRHYFDECFKTTLKAPLEAIDLHIMVEGVTRSHTHQEVRQRTAVFAQESMRFAVKGTLDENVRPGPSIKGDRERSKRYYKLIAEIDEFYHWAIGDGATAEDARGILPHDTLTRLHHKVNLRNLMDEIGKRLCTQAQFEWRAWGASLRQAIAEYDPMRAYCARHVGGMVYVDQEGRSIDDRGLGDKWQFEYIANSPLFVPICFNSGKCMFKAQMDRGCTIRERVEAGAFEEIRTEEWAADPTAGWVR